MKAQIEIHEGNPDAKLSILVSVEGDDAKRPERIANETARRGRLRAPAQRLRRSLRHDAQLINGMAWLRQSSHRSLTIIRVESENRPNNELAGRPDPTILARLAEVLGSAPQSSDLVDVTIFVRGVRAVGGLPDSPSTTDLLRQIAALLENLDADQRAAGSSTRSATSPGARNQGLEPIEEGSKIAGLRGKVTYGSAIATLSLIGQVSGYSLHDVRAADEGPSSPPPAQHGHRADSRILSKPWEPASGITIDHSMVPKLDTEDLGLIKIFVNGSEVKWVDEGKYSSADEEAGASRASTDDPDQAQHSDLPPDVKVKIILPDGTEIAADVPMSAPSNR